MPSDNHQHRLRTHRISLAGYAYAITKCQNRNYPLALTDNPEFSEQIISTFLFCQEQNWLNLAAFVIMPDHYHLLFQLNEKKNLAQIVYSINSYTTNLARKQNKTHSPLWQEGYYEHAIRTPDKLLIQMQYIEDNPVRANLVSQGCQWKFSSANDKWMGKMKRNWIC